MEKEERKILERDAALPERLSELFLKLFGPGRGGDLELPPRESHEPPALES